ncbi:hypothetical protein [Rhizobium paknamense]|uniref:LPS-assembly lipoprotein n=1 Tax=Rhizobium paknamense TaxID=1206817 RepID=A0ABU0IDW4_9HYPH|nr:hypothetical protein [Rhizobium paknamense]MDQ0455887.1 hypothetical protein [Rhizobium paknamense]
MLLFRLRFFLVLIVSLAVAGCVSALLPERPKRFYYDVRAVTVLAGPRVPVSLIEGIERRMQASVEATTRADLPPRVILTVRIKRFDSGIGLNHRLNEAEVEVKATYVENGSDAAEGDFKVQTETLDPALAAESLAEAVAARLRSLFSLKSARL